MIGAVIVVLVIACCLCFLCGYQSGWIHGYNDYRTFKDEMNALEAKRNAEKELLNESDRTLDAS